MKSKLKIIALIFFLIATYSYCHADIKFKTIKKKEYVDIVYWYKWKIYVVANITSNCETEYILIPTDPEIRITIYYNATDKSWYECNYVVCNYDAETIVKGWCNIHVKSRNDIKHIRERDYNKLTKTFK